jgi:hypothetical protein
VDFDGFCLFDGLWPLPDCLSYVVLSFGDYKIVEAMLDCSGEIVWALCCLPRIVDHFMELGSSIELGVRWLASSKTLKIVEQYSVDGGA